jgi:hypothetical protein
MTPENWTSLVPSGFAPKVVPWLFFMVKMGLCGLEKPSKGDQKVLIDL